MSENVSSNVLFHFTKSMRDLRSILHNGFFPHYCPEYSLDTIDKNAASQSCSPMRAAPMVCFCDLPLSLIRKHLKAYGNFGIGLDKKWGLKNGVAPVIYTHAKARTRQPVWRLTVNAANNNDKIAVNDLEMLATYTKPYVGPAWRNNNVEPRVRFYDEREWRYVPVIRGVESLFLDRKDYNNTSKKNKLYKQFKKQNALPIPPDVIQYLIVPYDKYEKNIFKLHAYVMKLYSRKDAILVTTAIMTDDRIQEDV
ncbi:MAG: abortive infection system antitoxin AbiGi family protein [Planctomycetota bacterium]